MNWGELKDLMKDMPDSTPIRAVGDKLPLPGEWDVHCCVESGTESSVLLVDVLYPSRDC